MATTSHWPIASARDHPISETLTKNVHLRIPETWYLWTWQSSGNDGRDEVETRQWLEAPGRMHTHDCLCKSKQ